MLIGHRDAQGRIERYSAVMRDVSQAVAREQEILRQSATLRSVADAMPAIVSVLDEQGRYRFVNAAFERWYGQPAANALGLDAREVLGEAEYARRAPWIERALAGETVTFDLAYPGSATHQAISYIPLRLPDGRTEGMVVVGQDVTGHKREAARLLQLAQHDPLTGLLNRAGFEQALQSMRDMAEGRGVALLYIDMDRFKPVNDRHGHAVGAQLLKIFAQRLLGLVRPTDAVARLGGDEFGVALIGLRDPSNADFVADKLLAAAHEPFIIERLRLQVGASVGVAYAAQAPDDWQALLAIADAQLLRAKAGGRGRRLSTAGATG
jgi:diguanylate cyclase (GGDEF)-like protein/PAS domain S-box-containing protein